MASLLPSTSVLGLRKAKHLLRRASFSYSKKQIDEFALLTPTEALDKLIPATPDYSYILRKPYDPRGNDPSNIDFTELDRPNTNNNIPRTGYVAGWWWYNAMKSSPSLKYKISFFLHTCFTVGKETIGKAPFFFDHVRLLDFYASNGNVKNLAKKISFDVAMLNYLDNSDNQKDSPNENYAREFLELFTILKGEQVSDTDYTTFTEIDVQQAARVLTGFRRQKITDGKDRFEIDNGSHDGLENTGIFRGYVNTFQHDLGNKTFSHRFGNKTIVGATDNEDTEGAIRELHEFVDMVFFQQATAKSYCRKLYRYFVKSNITDEIEDHIINPLATDLYEGDYNILPIIKKLLISQHFYDEDDTNASDEIIGGLIKSPLQLVSEVCSVFNLEFPTLGNLGNPKLEFYHEFFFRFLHNRIFTLSGFDIFNPESVAGYPAYFQPPAYDKNWFSSNTLVARYALIRSLIEGVNLIAGSKFELPVLDTLVLGSDDNENKLLTDPSNPNAVVFDLANVLYPESISEDRKNYFKEFLLVGAQDGGATERDTYWTINWNDYISGDTRAQEAVKSRLDALVIAMVNAAEFQIM